MKTPKERFKELKSEIEAKKFELKLKSKHATFDYRILVLEAEMKGIAETMEFIYNEEKHHKFTKADCIKGARAHNSQRRLYNEKGMFTCCRCKQTKLIKEFSKNNTKWNKLDSFCKLCRRGYQKKKYESNRI